MRDQCCIHKRGLRLLFQFFIYFRLSSTFFFYGFKVGIFDIASTQQIFSMQFNRFVHTLKSSRLGMGLLN